VKETLRIVAPTVSLRNTIVHSHLKWVLKGFHSKIMLSSFKHIIYIINTTVHFAAMGYKSVLKVIIYVCQKHKFLFVEIVYNMVPLYARKVIPFEYIKLLLHIAYRGNCCFQNKLQSDTEV
jgi:hypothetical protein